MIGPVIFDPYSPDTRRNPYPAYEWLLENEPVQRGAHDLCYVARYSDVRTVMSDRRFGRSEFRRAKLKTQGAGPLSDITDATLFYIDPPDHERLHQLIRGAFSRGALRQLEPMMRRRANDLLDAASGELDAIAEFARPFPLAIIAELIGVPQDDLDRLHDWALALAETSDPVIDGEAIARANGRMTEYTEYILGLLAQRRRRPRPDLLSRLLEAESDRISEMEIVAMVMVVVSAGHDTTTGLLGNSLLALIRHPGQFRVLRAEPHLLASAIEECLRYDPPVQQNARVVQADRVELGSGHVVTRGETVIALQGAANRDREHFADPNRFDIRRSPNRHISFGAGMRFCLGAALARLEGAIALEALMSRSGEFRLAIPEEELSYIPSSLFRVLERLPIAYTPR